MSDLRIQSLNFDRGIENIAYAGKENIGDHLPERHALPPSTQGGRAQLDELLNRPGADSFLADALRPNISNRELLMPGRFSGRLSAALSALEKAGTEMTGDKRALNRAVRLLKEETGMRELVAMYRSALYQG